MLDYFQDQNFAGHDLPHDLLHDHLDDDPGDPLDDHLGDPLVSSPSHPPDVQVVSQVQGFAPGDLQGLFAHDRFHLEEGVGMDLRVGMRIILIHWNNRASMIRHVGSQVEC